MPVIFGDVKNVTRIPLEGVLWVFSPEWRPGGASVVSMNRSTYEISGGKFRTDEVIPGPCVFEFRSDGEGQVRRQRYEFIVPEQDEDVNFLDLLDGETEYPPPVVGQAQTAAREARQAATEAEAAAQRVGDVEAVSSRVDTVESAVSAKVDSASVSQSPVSSTVVQRTAEGRVQATDGVSGGEVVTYRQLSAVEVKADEVVSALGNRPASLADSAGSLEGTGQDAAPALRELLSENKVVEIPAGTTWTINSGVIDIPVGCELRGGPGTVLKSGDSSAAYVQVSGGTLRDVTIDHEGKGGTTGVRVAAGSVQSRCLNVTVRGANRGFLIGETAGGAGGPALAPLLNGCNAVDAGEYGYLFEGTTGAIMVACRGNGAGLDIIKLRTKVRQLSIIGGEFTGAGRSASSAGDGLDGFAGAEGLTITGGAWFHHNSGNGVVVKSDDDSTGSSSIEDYRALNGKPQRIMIDGVTCSDNAGTGISIHRSDYQDSDVLTQSKPLPHLRDFVVTNFICADNTGAGMLVNARYGQISDGIAVRNRFHGLEILKEARDIGLSGIRSIANGYAGSSIDGFVIAGKRIRVHQCFAHGVDIYAVADSDLDGTDKDQRPTRFGFSIPTGAEVRLTDCGAYHTRVAALSDFPRSPMIGCDWRNPTTGDQFPAGIHAGATDLIGWREGPYLRKNGTAVEISADGRTGWRAI